MLNDFAPGKRSRESTSTVLYLASGPGLSWRSEALETNLVRIPALLFTQCEPLDKALTLFFFLPHRGPNKGGNNFLSRWRVTGHADRLGITAPWPCVCTGKTGDTGTAWRLSVPRVRRTSTGPGQDPPVPASPRAQTLMTQTADCPAPTHRH